MTSGAGGKSQDDIVMELAIELEGQLPNLLDRAVSYLDSFNLLIECKERPIQNQ